MDISPVFFYLFAGLAIAFSLLVVFKKSAISSAFALIMVFFSFAGIYAMLNAHLIAALQVIVYAGAVMVLFIFVIMFLNVDNAQFDMLPAGRLKRIFGAAVAALMLALFVWTFKNTETLAPVGIYTPEFVAQAGGNTQVISELMFSEYLLPFELTSVLLLGAIIGTVAMAKRKRAGKTVGGGK